MMICAASVVRRLVREVPILSVTLPSHDGPPCASWSDDSTRGQGQDYKIAPLKRSAHEEHTQFDEVAVSCSA